jgi:hypothetical protein
VVVVIVVKMKLSEEWIITRKYDDDVEMKVLASGALKVYIPMEIEVPPKGSKDEAIVTAPEKVLGVFNGTYIMTREDD